jgi:hypothetical protein
VSELLASALDRDPDPADERAPFGWSSKPMEALVDLEDKEALRRALGEP